MNSSLLLSSLFKNRLVVSNGVDTVEGYNLVTYTGGDIVAQLLAGNSAYKISHIAFEYENNAGAVTEGAAARSDTVATKLTALTGIRDYLKAPLSAVPSLSAGDGNHLSNVATFIATSTATSGIHSVAFGPGSNSKIYAVSLLASPTGVNTADVMFARYILGAVLPAVGAGQVSATWSVAAI
jgi:hypothetical protein